MYTVLTRNSPLLTQETPSAPTSLTTFIQVLPAAHPEGESKHTSPPHSELLMAHGQKGGQGEAGHQAFSTSGAPSCWGPSSRSQIMNAFSDYSRVCPLERAGSTQPGKNRARIPHLKQAGCWPGRWHRSPPETLTVQDTRAFFSPVKIRYEMSIKKQGGISHFLFLKNFYNLHHEIAYEDTGLST